MFCLLYFHQISAVSHGSLVTAAMKILIGGVEVKWGIGIGLVLG